MQTLSLARRTCIASVSAVEWTATVEMPSSRQARWILSAISPRLAIRTFSNIAARRGGSVDDEERFAVFDGRRVLDQHRAHGPGARALDRVHHLHRLDDQQRLALDDLVADLDEEGG